MSNATLSPLQRSIRQPSRLLRYSAAVLAVAITLLLILLLSWAIDLRATSFLLFFAPVIFSAWYGGLEAGLLATALSALALAYFRTPPFHSPAIHGDCGLRISLFVLEGVLLTCLTAMQAALRRSQAQAQRWQTRCEQLRLALEAANIAVWDWNMHTGTLTWSNSHERLFGRQPGSFPGTCPAFLECVHPEDRQSAEEALTRAMESKSDCSHDFRVIWPDGSTHCIAASGAIFSDETGKPAGTLGAVWDTTASVSGASALRNQAEEKRAQLRERERTCRSEAQRSERPLAETKEQYRIIGEILESSTDAFISADSQWRYTYLNAQAEKLLGKTRQELIGKNMWEIFPETPDSQYYQCAHQAVAQQVTVAYEEFYPQLDKWFAVRLHPSLDSLSIYLQDITSRVRAQEAQRQSEERLRLALEAADMVAWDWNLLTGEMMQSPNATPVMGLPPDKAVKSAQEFFNLIHPDDRERVLESLSGAIAEKTNYSASFRLVRPDGTVRWMADSGRVSCDQSGSPVRMSGVIADITELKQAEKKLQLSNERLKLLSETSSELLSVDKPLALIDSLFKKLSAQMGLDVYFNYLVEESKQMLQLASCGGISAQLAKEIEWLDFGQAVCGTAAQQRCQIVRGDIQQSADPKTELVRSLGVSAYSCQPLMARGRIFGTLSFGSRTRSAFTPDEVALMQAVCDCMALAMERTGLIVFLQQQTEELREANRLKDEFLAVVSHELRTPLTAMLGWAQMIRREKLGEAKMAQAVETIERNAVRQKQLIEDLLDVSRIITGKLRVNLQPVDLVAAIEASLDTVRPTAEAKGIELVFVREPDTLNPPLQIAGDPDRLQQIFWNLLSNAIKFTPAKGQVEIWLSVEMGDLAPGAGQNNQSPIPNPKSKIQNPKSKIPPSPIPCAQIQVSDTGTGIAPEFLPFVFERFRQADSSSTRTHGGLGLGLAIVRHLAELHGGTVGVTSEGVGLGARFTVRLPLAELGVGRWASGSGEQPPLPSTNSMTCTPLTGLRVLVVDDEPDSRDLVCAVLEHYGASVTAVASTSEALQALQRSSPDVLVSDIGMPGEDGCSLIRQLRAKEALLGQYLPAAALTAYAQEEERRQALEAGFQTHLAKPVEPALLADAVAALAGRRAK